jgi:hypothetical protein
MARVIEDALTDPNASDSVKMRALRLAINIEGREEDRQREHGSNDGTDLGEAATRPELVEQLAATLASNPLIARRLSAVLASATAGLALVPQDLRFRPSSGRR